MFFVQDQIQQTPCFHSYQHKGGGGGESLVERAERQNPSSKGWSNQHNREWWVCRICWTDCLKAKACWEPLHLWKRICWSRWHQIFKCLIWNWRFGLSSVILSWFCLPGAKTGSALDSWNEVIVRCPASRQTKTIRYKFEKKNGLWSRRLLWWYCQGFEKFSSHVHTFPT